MSQHYTRSTVEVSAYCNKCSKMTPHTVSDRRLGYCIPCYDKPLPVQPDLPRYLVEPGLFDKDEEDQA
jgi:hypothetical protein